MKSFLATFAGFIVILDASTANEVKKLSVVSYFIGLGNLYERVRDVDPSSQITPTALETKNNICRQITSSPFFLIWNQCPVNILNEYDNLKLHYPKIFESLYEKSTDPDASRAMVYTNPINRLDLSSDLGSNFMEAVFVCLTRRNCGTKDFVEYFISQQYNVSGGSNSADYRAGRFIFRRDGDERLSLFALAEEPARVSSAQDSDVERIYLDRRREQESADNIAEDPLCKQNLDEKVRICALVLESTHFEGRLQFEPTIHHIGSMCERKIVAFRNDDVNSQTDGKNFEEWVVKCLVNQDESLESVYYLSQAYKANDVFVYARGNEDGKIFVEGVSHDIRFNCV